MNDDDTQLRRAQIHASSVLPPTLAVVAVQELQTAINSRTLLERDFRLAAEILSMPTTRADHNEEGTPLTCVTAPTAETSTTTTRGATPAATTSPAVKPWTATTGNSTASAAPSSHPTEAAEHYAEFNAVLRSAAQVARDHGDTMHANEFDIAVRVHQDACHGLDVCFYPTVARNFIAANRPGGGS